ncbi:MAG: methylcobamide--CoM methyltransferase [Clostridia bacterium]|nr:methylcobamide--CoM methyltransferase [Clostridia bacterium]
MNEILTPLTRDELCRVIEGRGTVGRVPMMIHFWANPSIFGDRKEEAARLLESYPFDFQPIWFGIPSIYNAPADDPSYRWCWHDEDTSGKALDNAGFIKEWETDLDPMLDDFPSADYPGLISGNVPGDGRYRLGCWWYFFFERFWSIRGMEDALTDFYLYPDEVHRLFRRLTDFYLRMVERGKYELGLDGIFTSDDLGTQKSTFFSSAIFDEFFYPYYKEIIDRVHSLGMHFWLHTCGNIEAFLPRFIDLGIDVLHPIQKYTMDERKIAEKYGDRISIWAGFDVQQTIPYGTPEDVRREVRFLIDAYARPDGRFMLTLGNGATPDTPYESLEALLSEIAEYGSEKIRSFEK